MIQVLVEIEPGTPFFRHSHPGEEIIYVVSGELEYEVEGRPNVTLKAGEVLFIPYGKIHAARSVGNAKVLSWPRMLSRKESRSLCQPSDRRGENERFLSNFQRRSRVMSSNITPPSAVIGAEEPVWLPVR